MTMNSSVDKLKLHLGCGGIQIPGWINKDMEVDLRKRLPYGDKTVDFIFTEHVIEHLIPTEVWKFFEECKRVLKTGGVVRTTFPSIVKTWGNITPSYLEHYRKSCDADGTPKSGIRHLVFNWGHQSLWTPDLLVTILEAIGFRAREVPLYGSAYSDLVGIDARMAIRAINDIESVSVEGVH